MELEQPVVVAIRCPVKLKERLGVANKAKAEAGLSEVDWNSVSSFFKAVARDDAAKMIYEREDKKNPTPPDVDKDHVFELQYFTVAFLYSIADAIVENPKFYPQIDHVTYAMALVNAKSNLVNLKKDVHAVKSAFFRAGKDKDGVIPNDKAENRKKLLEYLKDTAQIFRAELTALLQKLEHQFVFHKHLLENLLATPWCNAESWTAIIDANKRFCVKETKEDLYELVLNDWIQSNSYYEVSLANEDHEVQA